MIVYDSNGSAILKPGVSVDAVHEEELMKSDFVRPSWSDADRYVIKAGAYVTPFLDNKNHEGDPMKYMLFRDYVPEQMRPGEYSYKPEFQHPKMWLGYVPFLFSTYDAANQPVKKTEYEYVGSLGALLSEICGCINNALADAGFIGEHDDRFSVYPVGVDMDETVTVSFDKDDILSAIAKVCDATGYEYHLEWIEMESDGQRYDQKLFCFGSIYLGGAVGEDDEFELEIDRNIGVPKVTESKDKQYNRFYVQGGTRNNAIQGEHGNIALNTRLTLVGYTNPGDPTADPPVEPHTYAESIIDTRPAADQGSPGLTGIITKDEVYPHLELYLYDLHERKKFKTDDNGNVTTEPWSVWYFKLAYRHQGDWVDFLLFSDPKTKVESLPEGDSVPVDLSADDYGLPKRTTQEGTQMTIDLMYNLNGSEIHAKTGIKIRDDAESRKFELVPLLDDADAANFRQFKDGLAVNKELHIKDEIDLSVLPYANVTTHAIDGLAPSVGFLINSNVAPGTNPNALGTREFEIKYNSTPVTFNAKDDQPNQTGIDAGYYEIIHTTEGSNDLIMPTTGEEGIAPYATDGIQDGHVVPSLNNSKVQLFNVVIGNEYKTAAQAELELAAKVEIARIMADQNQYTAPANPVAFEEHKPDIKIGRRVAFDDAAGYRINSRIIRLVTKLDYDFDVEITIGNTLMKRFSDRVMAQIAKLGSGTGGYDKIDLTPQAQTVTTVEYQEWIQGTPYFFEAVNKKTGILETSYVWHRGKKWMCLRTLTTEEPHLGCSDWKPVEGDMAIHVDFEEDYQLYDPDDFRGTLTVVCKWGTEDVTAMMAQRDFVWTRYTEDGNHSQRTDSDGIWNSGHSYAAWQTGRRQLTLRQSDLNAETEFPSLVRFRCDVTVRDSSGNALLNDYVQAVYNS